MHEKYDSLSQIFLKNGGHQPDNIIIIETHDLGLKHDLSLITFDKGMCKACNETKELSIECILCE